LTLAGPEISGLCKLETMTVAGHAHTHDTQDENLMLGDKAKPLYEAATVAAMAGLAIALILGWIVDHSLRRFFFAYLVAFAFFLSISLGALIMVLMQFLTRAAWSVSVRRIAENLAGQLPMLGVLSIPLICTVLLNEGTVYPWAIPNNDTTVTQATREAAARGESEEEGMAPVSTPEKPMLDANVLQKRSWLNPWSWIARVVLYFVCWSVIASWFRRQSVLQDENGDPELTRKMQMWSGLAVLIVVLTLTGAAVDFLMCLDPHWFSTIFGFYYLAGSILGSWAALIVIASILQRAGFVTKSINVEHYHDLGKYLFGFTFFWGYIAFSQYMLLWYANIPEEIHWYTRHGATTAIATKNAWGYVILALLFGQLLIPFASVMSRHVKRNLGALFFWGCWVLAFHFLDIYWMVMPEYQQPGGKDFTTFSLVIDAAALLGVGGVYLASLLRTMSPHSLRPTQDPRLPECLAFHNI
jgi:hypothetical protein